MSETSHWMEKPLVGIANALYPVEEPIVPLKNEPLNVAAEVNERFEKIFCDPFPLARFSMRSALNERSGARPFRVAALVPPGAVAKVPQERIVANTRLDEVCRSGRAAGVPERQVPVGVVALELGTDYRRSTVGNGPEVERIDVHLLRTCDNAKPERD